MNLKTIAIISIIVSLVCSLIIIVDIVNKHRQKMWIMNIVWPVTALYSGIIGLWAYFKIGRTWHKDSMHPENGKMQEMGNKEKKLTWPQVIKGTLHCGSGCTLGDIVAEFGLVIFPLLIVENKLFNRWIVDYFFAFLFGIIFQYFSIKPMRNLSPGKALSAALKADTLSLTFWQIGMYGWMAISVFLIFDHLLEPTDPVFWLMMQIGMLLGFITSFPVNWWLMKKGIKEAM